MWQPGPGAPPVAAQGGELAPPDPSTLAEELTVIARRISLVLMMLALGAVAISAQTPPPPEQARPKLKPRSEAQTPKPQLPTLALEVGAVTPVVAGVTRAWVTTICVGDRVLLRARVSDPDVPPTRYAWVSSGGQIIGEGAEVYLDTTDLPPGEYHVTAQAIYRGIGACGGDCSAYDSTTIRVSPCPPQIICFTSPVITVTPETRTAQAGDAVTFTASEVSGGQGYGDVTYVWTSSAGEITSQGTRARLDTTGVAPETVIEVNVTALTDVAECSAKGSARVVMATPPRPPQSRELMPCTTFKHHQSRVDNACKYILSDAARALQADARAQLVVDAFRGPQESEAVALARGKNVRDRLADGSLGVMVDANRIVVRMGGVARDGSQVRLYFVPSGAEMPHGPQEVQLGPVESEKRSVRPARGRSAPRR
jgi:hypothetical protein